MTVGIDRDSYHQFQPLLYQVATGILSEGEVAPPTRRILRRQRNTQILFGEVISIDLAARTVLSEALGTTTVTPYDFERIEARTKVWAVGVSVGPLVCLPIPQAPYATAQAGWRRRMPAGLPTRYQITARDDEAQRAGYDHEVNLAVVAGEQDHDSLDRTPFTGADQMT